LNTVRRVAALELQTQYLCLLTGKVPSLLMLCRNLDITVPSINQININTCETRSFRG